MATSTRLRVLKLQYNLNYNKLHPFHACFFPRDRKQATARGCPYRPPTRSHCRSDQLERVQFIAILILRSYHPPQGNRKGLPLPTSMSNMLTGPPPVLDARPVHSPSARKARATLQIADQLGDFIHFWILSSV